MMVCDVKFWILLTIKKYYKLVVSVCHACREGIVGTTTAAKEHEQLWQLVHAQSHHAAAHQVIRCISFSTNSNHKVCSTSEHAFSTTSNYPFGHW
jgi:hypothetical protein